MVCTHTEKASAAVRACGYEALMMMWKTGHAGACGQETGKETQCKRFFAFRASPNWKNRVKRLSGKMQMSSQAATRRERSLSERISGEETELWKNHHHRSAPNPGLGSFTELRFAGLLKKGEPRRGLNIPEHREKGRELKPDKDRSKKIAGRSHL